MKKIILILLVIVAVLAIYFLVTMKLNSYNLFMMNTPKKVPVGFKRVSVVKEIPPEKDWLLKATYENGKKQQFIFVEEPKRNIRCGQEEWKKDLANFRPSSSSAGCSFYLENFNKEKIVNVHWFLWNVGNNTYHIYDQESVLSDQQVYDLAESMRQEIIVIKDLKNKK